MTARRDREQPSNPGHSGDASPGAATARAVPDTQAQHPTPDDRQPGAQPTPQHGAQARSRDPAGGAFTEQASGQEQASGAVQNSDDQLRAGVDARRRGWFWHWNSVVTQYAPLLGLKGVGLLNSYTVWTDRREESPHRGYAFPSQQSEADFYGEERSELITINKILVALDLIEIRKEMVLRIDERGRRWRVPHNLYRVKDRPDGVDLRAEDVLRVASLAKDDATVFRYVRRVFSPRFKPIDRDNVWHAILTELADNPLWLELQLRTEQQESRASARSRAGHRTRATRDEAAGSAEMTVGQLQDDTSARDERPASRGGAAATTVAGINTGLAVATEDVATSNSASTIAVAGSNAGLGAIRATSEAQSNTGRLPNVAPSNSTYHQAFTTTTTTTSVPEDGAADSLTSAPPADDAMATVLPVAQPTTAADNHASTEGAPATTSGQPDTEASRSGIAPATSASTTTSTTTNEPATPHEHERATAPHLSDVHAERNGIVSVALVADEAGDQTHRFDSDGRGTRGETAATRQADAAHGGSGSRSSDEDGETTLGRDEMGPAHPGLAYEETAADQRAAGAGVGTRAGVRDLVDGHGGGPLGDPSALVVSLFEAANDRRSSALERILLAELEHAADPAARAAGASGAEWVAAALREAVASGSAFVAPKRIREIITRWSRESAGPEASGSRPGRAARHIPPPPAAGPDTPQHTPRSAPQAPQPGVAAEPEGSRAAAVRLPGGADGARVWSEVLVDLARLLDAAAFERLLAGSVISRFRQGTVEVLAPNQGAAEKLSAEYRPLVERHLNARLPRAVAVRFMAEPAAVEAVAVDEQSVVELGTATIVISRADYELASRVWQALRADLSAALPARDLEGLGAVVPLGEDAGGVMLLGTTSSRALRLVDGRCRAEIERALSGLLGRAVTVRAISSTGWSVAPPG